MSSRLKIHVGPERHVLSDGLQPFLFRTRRGTLFVQAQLTAPPGFVPRTKDVIPGDGTCGSALSRDGGRTWGRYLPDAWRRQLPYFEGAYVSRRDGTSLLTEWIARGPTARGEFTIVTWESRDDLQTMRGPILGKLSLPQAKRGGYDDGGRPYSGLTFHRTVLELPNGHLLAVVYGWFKGDETPCPYMPRMCKFRCFVLRSRDRARHWEYLSTVAVDPRVGEEGFNEPVMVRLSRGPHRGRLICLMRTGSHQCPIYQAVSDDDGASWSPPVPQWFCGVDPDLIEMRDGTLVCSFGWRMKRWTERRPPARFGNYLVFSRDQGATWTNLTRLPLEAQAHTPWTTCYTTVREIGPQRLLVAYDVGRWGMPVRYIASREVRVEAGKQS
jgi:hypothetical protein